MENMETATVALQLEMTGKHGPRTLDFSDNLENYAHFFNRVVDYLHDTALQSLILASTFESRRSHIEWIMSFSEHVLYKIPMVPPEYLSPMLLIIHEAVSNAVYHGNLCVPDSVRTSKTFHEYEQEVATAHPELLSRQSTMRLFLFHDHGELSISDSGKGFDYQSELDRDQPPSPESEMGRGIYILKQTADEICFQDNGKTLHVRKNWRQT
ncbi:MAG: ATP-binding protein [Acidobacteria bacterium]|nr:ATP-binding protein [Acidobacteriota bacterium]